jgi:hypothetical protein
MTGGQLLPRAEEAYFNNNENASILLEVIHFKQHDNAFLRTVS